MSSVPVLELRRTAVEQTIAHWRDKPFEMPKHDCFKMEVFLLRLLGVPLRSSSKCIGYKTPLAARATLKRVYGVRSMVELNDKFFKRIAPAFALPGDIIAMPGWEDGTLGAVGIYMGNELVFCYEEEHDTPQAGRLTYDPDREPLAAWSVLP